VYWGVYREKQRGRGGGREIEFYRQSKSDWRLKRLRGGGGGGGGGGDEGKARGVGGGGGDRKVSKSVARPSRTPSFIFSDSSQAIKKANRPLSRPTKSPLSQTSWAEITAGLPSLSLLIKLKDGF
jgi:hypothetical protein